MSETTIFSIYNEKDEEIKTTLQEVYDALQEMLGLENYGKLLEKGVIEIAPLAYMRGRTLNHAFIILDEAQNTTPVPQANWKALSVFPPCGWTRTATTI